MIEVPRPCKANTPGGADFVFADRGNHVLEGIDGEWSLYAVESRKL